MKLTVFIDQEHEEEVRIYAHQHTKLIESIRQLIQDDADPLIGYKEKEMAQLRLADVHCFIVENNKIYALTQEEKWQLKCRLYNLEETLSEDFLKINKSCIANLKKIERFDASFSGSLQVKFKNGHMDYVSRRNLKTIKERFGL